MTFDVVGELAAWFAESPNDVAIRTPGESMSVSELVARASALSEQIRSHSKLLSQLIAVSADGVDEVVGLLAVCASGNIPVITPTQSEYRASGATMLVVRDREWAEPAAIRIGDDVSARMLSIDGGPTTIGLLTSGTTGKPKLAILEPAIIAARLDGYLDWWPTQNFATLFRLSAVSGLFTMLAAIRVRNPMAFIPVIDSSAVEFCNNASIRHIYGSPHQIASLIDVADRLGLPLSFDAVSSAGAPQTASFIAAVARVCDGDVRSVYGSTESGGIALSERPSELGFRGRIGRGAEVQVVDSGNTPVPVGEEGTVRYRAPGLIDHYLVDDVPTPVTTDGWFYPGDVGRLEVDGQLVVLRRDGDVVNVGGAKVSPLEFEALAESVPGVKDAGCAAVTFPDGSAHLVLAVVVRDDAAYQSVIAACGSLSETNRPNIVVAVPSIPRNRNGKLMRDDLAERLTRSIRVKQAT